MNKRPFFRLKPFGVPITIIAIKLYTSSHAMLKPYLLFILFSINVFYDGVCF